ncbi:MAG: hypothetical protein ACI4MA_00385 [Treponema sp.]
MEKKEKKYHGYGYHGGGRKKIPDEEKTVYKTFSINVTPRYLEVLKKLAKQNNVSVNKLVTEAVYMMYRKDFEEAFHKKNLSDR